MVDVNGVEVVHWNPQRTITRRPIGRYLPSLGATRNFGDMLAPAIVRLLIGERLAAGSSSRLVAVGSIMHLARDGDVVWGTGVNGKVPRSEIVARRLDVRAVRGPLTASVLRGMRFTIPETYGDPGLLAPLLLGIGRAPSPRFPVTALPNLHDRRTWFGLPGYFSPRSPYESVIRRIADSAQVVTSSLHGIVIADALGVPVSLVRPGSEDMFKYEDYYEGTGRHLPQVHESFAAGIDSPAPPLTSEPKCLTAAFPSDLWATPRSPERR